MYPNLWIIDTYSVFLFLGVLFCLVLLYKYHQHNKLKRNYTYDILILGCISVLIGILSASLFQFIFDSLKENSTNGAFSMTFFGGLVGGVVIFLLGYKIYIKKRYPESKFINDILIIAPACITLAHGLGRIGCFFAGCCYGIQTDSIFGVKFPHLSYNVYPTQLYEAIFLILLSGVLSLLAFKYKNKYTMPIYLLSYGIFRFLIEFLRGDDRGAFLFGVISPSQVFSIICVLISIGLSIYLYKTKLNSTNTEACE